MLKLKIERLTSRTVKTRNGDSESLSLFAGGKWYSAWSGPWNEDWAVGDEIEIHEDRIEKTAKGDKEYLNIKSPPKGSDPAKIQGVVSGDVMDALRKLYKICAETKAEVAGLKEALKVGGRIPL